METPPKRRSDRIVHVMPIRVYGNDVSGEAFEEEGQTSVLSRHGAAILLKRSLSPEQFLALQRCDKPKETEARIVGLIEHTGETYLYGVAFLDNTADLWEIDFPAPSESDAAVGRILLECRHCASRELVYLDEFEAEVFEVNRTIFRDCKRCRDRTLWREPAGATGEAASEQKAPQEGKRVSIPADERRQHTRAKVKLTALIRHIPDIEEVVKTENVSRGGLCFRSRRNYYMGLRLDVCLPYTGGRANIFVPAKIVRVRALPGEYILTEYGLEYIKTFGAADGTRGS